MAMRAPGLQFFILAACFMSLPEGQGQQIKSMRCDRKVKFTQNTPCTSCLIAQKIQCPNDWQRVFQYKGKCRPSFECPGGSQNVCSGHGVCLDGMARNGTCICESNYGGYACQECRDENHFGPNCQSELPVCGTGKCEANSLCVVKDGQAWCECMPGYRKTGLHCQAQNPCSSSPCSSLALCKTLGPTKYECTCMEGYHGDGRVCQAINPCDTDNGGCPANSTTCSFESAGKVTYAQNLCKMHIIAGQHLLSDMIKPKELWTLSGHKVTFNYERLQSTRLITFRYSDIPGELYTIKKSNLPAANGIIHIVNTLRKKPMEELGNSEKTVAEILASMEIASRFQTILENCGLPSILDGPGPFTVFVPSNEAVDKLRDGRLIYLFTEGINKLQELVKHHIFSTAAVPVEILIGMPRILTMANQILKIHVSEDGRILLGDSEVPINKRNILASNGIIHTLDGIFIPPSIVPILPHRCNEQSYKIVEGSCVDCDALNTSVCPPQSQVMDHEAFPGDCIYIHDPLGLNMIKKGCNKKCKQTIVVSISVLMGFEGMASVSALSILKELPATSVQIQTSMERTVMKIVAVSMGFVITDQEARECARLAHAICISTGPGTATCQCNRGWSGDGKACVAIDNCVLETRGGCHINADCNYIGPGQKSIFSIPERDNITVLVPLKEAIQNLSKAEKDFWLTPSMLPPLVSMSLLYCRSHFLQGSLTTEKLKNYVGQKISTLNPRIKWLINNSSGDNETMQYHVILGVKLLPQNLKSGVHKPTMLGMSYWLMFYKNTTEAYVNKVLLNGQFLETRNGILISISQVLQIQKNRCNTNTTTIQKLLKLNRRFAGTVPTGRASIELREAEAPGKGNLPHCQYKSGTMKLVGCHFTCVKVSLVSKQASFIVSVCCPGYYGHMCEMCPGEPGNWCSGSGVCQDGLDGNGECQCQEGYHGTACEMCQPGRYGANCTLGLTDDRMFLSLQNAAASMGNATMGCWVMEAAYAIMALRGPIVIKNNLILSFCKTEIDPCVVGNGGCSAYANCNKVGPGERTCTCQDGYAGDGTVCREIDRCLENNGGCHRYAECVKTGPGLDNGGCSPLAICLKTRAGNRTCICLWGSGDGFTCTRTVWQIHGITEVMGSGPYTVFVPHNDYLQNSTTNSVYLNDEAKIIESDITGTNGVIHFIDKILMPYDLQNYNISSNLSEKSITEVAEAYGYKMYSKLLTEAGLLNVVNNTFHQPFTMLWPTDTAFNSLPTNMQKWLYHKEHRSKLVAYLKGHMIRDMQALASRLTESPPLRTLHGSTISFSCSKTHAGDILVDNGNARIVQRYMQFNVGIAYGIDKLLEPPDLGSRCDEFHTVEISNALCGACGFEHPCPLGSVEVGESQSCLYFGNPVFISPRYNHFESSYLPIHSSQRRLASGGFQKYRWKPLKKSLIKGCKRTCFATKWVPQCCANHYGKNCHVCPGGLEAPCSNRGTCDDGHGGSGQCNCNATFIGTSCEHCAPGRYGPECKECNCTENGICNEGLHGDGFCFCTAGWIGERCETKLAEVPTCFPACHPNAICRANNTCECKLYYEGDGMTCTVIDQCGKDKGGCSDYANCTQIGIEVSCSCFSDYEGDGYVCSPIDRCADGNNGDCSEHATCISIGPNSRRCECKPGYVGNGIQCLEEAIPPIDRCLEENGQCHSEAVCTDLHFHDKTIGIFHLQSPKGKYSFTYQEAETSCAAEGATVATLQQLSAAQQMGFHLCIVGWLYNRTAGYPTVYPSKKCGGQHVGIVNYGFRNNISEKWDAYCYRAQDVRCTCRDGFIGDGYTCIGNLLAVLGQYANFSLYYSMLLDYANSTQDGADFLDFLSTDTTYKTLFVPMNSGFRDNTSLTLTDLKLHVSASDMFLWSVNLTAGTIIPSQAGFNLSITDSVNNTQFPDSKMVNNTVIVEWDILASNGIIHAIETPLMIPLQRQQPEQVASPVKSPAAMTIGVSTVAVVVLCAAIAGVSYYYLKRTNQRFQFRYFKAELEDEEPSSWEERSPHSVSIPNPIYGTDSSIYEPFEDSLQGDLSDTHGILGHY
ncbi:hypothetical protein JD844_012626 [Phrynosoma platyrhinos]|uniref:Stabilin-1 n=1 Tax=Phrynosoma platyrhinos TaxID=52577 RepID=A0ABQ7TK65_PHRPL|nr:hypothetical protein JD844_012626 [Phrynosoma platyrhinos]